MNADTYLFISLAVVIVGLAIAFFMIAAVKEDVKGVSRESRHNVARLESELLEFMNPQVRCPTCGSKVSKSKLERMKDEQDS